MLAAHSKHLLYWNSSANYAGHSARIGAVAHSGERFNGIEEVEGSIPSSSTKPTVLPGYATIVLACP